MLVFFIGTMHVTGFSQDEKSDKPSNMGSLSGALDLYGNFFIRDSVIGASGTPQYERQKYSADGWLTLNYNYKGFDLGLRFDLFNNSYLLNPSGSYTAQGIGRWYVRKQVDKLNIYVGYIYDQIGSGSIFRAYEERFLAIDNALVGIRVGYDITKNLKIKAFTGKQKQQFDTYNSILKGAAVDWYYKPKEDSKWSTAPGAGIVVKTLSDQQGDFIKTTLQTYHPNDSIGANYNTWAYSFYNTLSIQNFSWYAEAAFKRGEVFLDPNAVKTLANGELSKGKYVNRPGTHFYSAMSYAGEKLGASLELKRTEDFTFRADPTATFNRGIINFLPPMSKVSTYRMTTRYVPATQELGEKALQADIRYKVNKKLDVGVNYSDISRLDDLKLYQEINVDFTYKNRPKWQLTAGLQRQVYNQDIYLEKKGLPNVETWTPYVEYLYKFNRKQSLRFEGQYMATEQDFGSWIFALLEYGIAPHWTISVSDMYNSVPKKHPDPIHYPSIVGFYSVGATRISAGYVKQVEGIVCTGGICRFEPAFNGFKMTLNTLF